MQVVGDPLLGVEEHAGHHGLGLAHDGPVRRLLVAEVSAVAQQHHEHRRADAEGEQLVRGLAVTVGGQVKHVPVVRHVGDV